MYVPFTCDWLARYALACSSDQKKTELRQKASMMFGSMKCCQSTSGTNSSGCAPGAPGSWTLHCNSLSTVRWISRPQWAHAVSISTTRVSSRKRPCTKGVASASSAQAAKTRSPLLKLKRWGVVSQVTGNAQLISPISLRTRKKRFFCRSSRIVVTRETGRPSLFAISSTFKGCPWLRGNSRTAKLRTRRWLLVMKPNVWCSICA